MNYVDVLYYDFQVPPSREREIEPYAGGLRFQIPDELGYRELAKLGLLDVTAAPFYNSAFDEGLIYKTFGIPMEETDLKLAFNSMESIESSKIKEDVNKMKKEYKQVELSDLYYTN